MTVLAEMSVDFFHERLADEDGITTIQGFIDFDAAHIDQGSQSAFKEAFVFD